MSPSWAKAPEFTADARARLNQRTERDRREYLEGGLQPLDCRHCATRVLVKKNSHAHTSVQWTSDASLDCPFFAERAALGENTALLYQCPHLQASIDDAVRDGLIEVPDPG